jgi:ArsR family transcriptional regulator
VLTAPLAPDQANVLAKGFSALGDPVRLRVLSMLAAAPTGEICVCDFVEPLGKTQGTVSHHLRILSEAGLVHGDRRGKWVWYSLDRFRLADLRGALES